MIPCDNTKVFKYTIEFGTQGGYNAPQPGMTRISGNLYDGHDGYIYDMMQGSRRRKTPEEAKTDFCDTDKSI
jgi:hypothetical protein